MTFLDFLTSAADDCGTISWHQAVIIAARHGHTVEFDNEYSHLAGERIDAGELAVWLGY